MDQQGKEALPTLYECLEPIYDGNALVRPGGRLSIFCEGAMWVVKLDLPFEVLTCRIAASSLPNCLLEMDTYLRSPGRVLSPGYSGKKKKLTALDAVIE